MSFFVDIVTEDSFYENLTLGVVKFLEASPCVRNVRVERRGACDRSAISSWEQRHCCLLPEDLKSFYTSIDGFSLTWSLDIGGEEYAVGRMSLNEFAALKRYMGTKDQQAEAEIKSNDESDAPSLSAQCKLFEMDHCGGSKIFLVYNIIKPDSDIEPSIWLYNEEHNGSWYQLAENFTKYFRMMLVHLGLPFWQHCAAGLPLKTWVEHVYYLVGPHLLSDTIRPSDSVATSLWNDGPPNIIDPAIFRGRDTKQRNSRKK